MMAHWCSICGEPCLCCTEECEHDCPETTIEKKQVTISKSRAEPSQSGESRFLIGKCKHCGKEVGNVADGKTLVFCSYECYCSD